MADVINFPPPSDRPTPDEVEADTIAAETDIEALHAKGFRDLEDKIGDCVSMAKIAFDQICDLKTEDRELVFAVAHTWEMLAKLKRDYYAAWHNEPGGLHTPSI